jgi:hypothetical protein
VLSHRAAKRNKKRNALTHTLPPPQLPLTHSLSLSLSPTLSARGDNQSEAAGRIKTQLMIEMNGVGTNNNRVLVLAATNLPYTLDQVRGQMP